MSKRQNAIAPLHNSNAIALHKSSRHCEEERGSNRNIFNTQRVYAIAPLHNPNAIAHRPYPSTPVNSLKSPALP
ncbi:hypothetical protein HUN01_22450 [Nostoc edaphicum CCNP1411]|uniref:Uncharacterized protein n=1 Tax=Nostoc edaphicum CCNP1411 TaxID=1472755 RepID=A0A7D7LCS9_9NOSO|nr:hypothetical protein [Nostoc edaphicum]QMS90213.1 hypothetical protein HUN01_22450 [Nostoc edaphicum CCNP1411]